MNAYVPCSGPCNCTGRCFGRPGSTWIPPHSPPYVPPQIPGVPVNPLRKTVVEIEYDDQGRVKKVTYS